MVFVFAGRFSGDNDTRPEDAGVTILPVVVVVGGEDDTRRVPVKLFNVRSIASSLDLAWSNEIVAPDCFGSREKSMPQNVRTKDAVISFVQVSECQR